MISRLVRSSRNTFVGSCRRFSGSVALDVTGNAVAVKNAQILAAIDEAILNMITYDVDPTIQLRSVISMDEQSGLANAMLAFELLRRPRLSHANGENGLETILKCLKTLEYMFENGTLSKRETYMSAAAAAYGAGNYTKAGALFENSLLHTKHDALALRLAQDSYIAGGSTSNTLGCVARWLHAFDDRHLLHGHVMGMLASGFLENGRFSEAEEAATRAVGRTGGRDVWALHTLLNTYLLMGRSSEVLAVLEDHQSKHDGIGLQQLVFNKGLALVQRGNYSGALRVHDDIVDNLLSDPANFTLESLSDATKLLWLISLNSTSAATAARWRDGSDTVAAAWKASGLLTRGNDRANECWQPSVNISATMALTGMAYRADAPVAPSISSSGVDTAEKPSPLMNNLGSTSLSVFNWIRGGGNKGSGSNEPTAPAATEPVKVFKAQDGDVNGGRTPDDFEKDLDVYLQRLYAQANSTDSVAYSSTIEALKKTCPKLLSIKPSFNLAAGDSVSPSTSNLTEKHKILRDFVVPISQGIASFGRKDYDGAATTLSGYRDSLRRLGGSCVQRDIISQTIIDSYLNSDRLTEARLLLCERTTLAPNDAQSWRRLAPLFARIGLEDHSATAGYTAWQLGIGQGGFGGPK